MTARLSLAIYDALDRAADAAMRRGCTVGFWCLELQCEAWAEYTARVFCIETAQPDKWREVRRPRDMEWIRSCIAPQMPLPLEGVG